MKNFRIWKLLTANMFQSVLTNRLLLVVFVFGKFIRIIMFLFFLIMLFKGTSGLSGYSPSQIIFFYLAFNFIDTFAQFLFREVYRFRPLIVSGDLDFVLLKPFNPLIRVLLGGADIMDLFMLIVITAVLLYVGVAGVTSNPLSWLMFFLLAINAVVISAALHIFVLGLGVITVSIDHLIMIYRDLTALMRIPVDLYVQPLRSLLTFILPLGIMFTFPPKALMGLLSWQNILLSFLASSFFLAVSLYFWRYSLKHYQSASS